MEKVIFEIRSRPEVWESFRKILRYAHVCARGRGSNRFKFQKIVLRSLLLLLLLLGTLLLKSCSRRWYVSPFVCTLRLKWCDNKFSNLTFRWIRSVDLHSSNFLTNRKLFKHVRRDGSILETLYFDSVMTPKIRRFTELSFSYFYCIIIFRKFTELILP